jgi:hypothetical protein
MNHFENVSVKGKSTVVAPISMSWTLLGGPREGRPDFNRSRMSGLLGGGD